MSDTTTDNLYEQHWHPRAYLRQYYETAYITDDEQANLSFMATELQKMGRTFRRALEVGCGPTLHHALPLVPYVEEIHLADYLAGNLDEVRRWLTGAPDAHDWDVYLRAVLEGEGDTTREALEARKDALRRKITALRQVDVRRERPLGDDVTYDLVASFYCVEAVAETGAEWESCLGNLSTLVAPGGVLLLSMVRNCSAYQVFDKAFPTARVDEDDLARALPGCGFLPEETLIQHVPIAEWVEQGFEGICCVRARRADAGES